jgi:hypothetical protein
VTERLGLYFFVDGSATNLKLFVTPRCRLLTLKFGEDEDHRRILIMVKPTENLVVFHKSLQIHHPSCEGGSFCTRKCANFGVSDSCV